MSINLIESTKTWNFVPSSDFWDEKEHNYVRSDLITFPFIPNALFRIVTVREFGQCASFFLTCDGDFVAKDFDGYTWVQIEKKVCGNKQTPYTIGHNVWYGGPFEAAQFYCKIVAKKGQLVY